MRRLESATLDPTAMSSQGLGSYKKTSVYLKGLRLMPPPGDFFEVFEKIAFFDKIGQNRFFNWVWADLDSGFEFSVKNQSYSWVQIIFFIKNEKNTPL